MTQLQVELEEQVEFEIAALGFAVFENAYTLIFVGVLNGLYLLAFGICMHIVITKKRNGRANQVMITLLVASFLMTVLFFIGYLMVPLVLVEFELMKVLPGGLMVQEIAASTQSMLVGAAICETWTVNLSVLIADAFVVWVAWVIWPRNRGFHCALAILMLVDIGLTFAVAIPSSENTLAVLKATTNTLDCVKILCSLLVNVVATLAIGYQGWKHHQSMQIISFRNQKTQVAAIFLLLVESGAIFGFIQLLNVIFEALNAHVATGSPLDKATNFLVILYVYAAGLNPVAIAVLVRLKRNYHDEPESSELPP